MISLLECQLQGWGAVLGSLSWEVIPLCTYSSTLYALPAVLYQAWCNLRSAQPCQFFGMPAWKHPAATLKRLLLCFAFSQAVCSLTAALMLRVMLQLVA